MKDKKDKKPFQRITKPKSDIELEMIRTQQILAIYALLSNEIYN